MTIKQDSDIKIICVVYDPLDLPDDDTGIPPFINAIKQKHRNFWHRLFRKALRRIRLIKWYQISCIGSKGLQWQL